MNMIEQLQNLKKKKEKVITLNINLKMCDIEFMAYKNLRKKLKCTNYDLFTYGVKALGEIDHEVKKMIDESWEEARKSKIEKKTEKEQDLNNSSDPSFFTLRNIVDVEA